MINDRIEDLYLYDARIFWRNFAGAATNQTPEGKRSFCVVIPEEAVDKLSAEGWNVKIAKPTEEGKKMGETGTPYLNVKVNYSNDRHKPLVYMITGNKKTALNEDTILLLDTAEIARVDLVINPSKYDVMGRKGISAYLKKMYVTIVEDELDKMYAMDDVNDEREEELFNGN